MEKDDVKEGIAVRQVGTILLFANDIDVAVPTLAYADPLHCDRAG